MFCVQERALQVDGEQQPMSVAGPGCEMLGCEHLAGIPGYQPLRH